MKDIGGISMPHIVDDVVVKGNVDLESASDQLLQQPISPMHMDFATVDHRATLQRPCFKIPYCEEDLILWLW